MADTAVLDIRPFADDDAADIGAQHAIVPHRTVGTDLDIADDGAAGRDEGAVMDFRRMAVNRNDGDARSGHRGAARGHRVLSHCSRESEYWIVGLSSAG